MNNAERKKNLSGKLKKKMTTILFRVKCQKVYIIVETINGGDFLLSYTGHAINGLRRQNCDYVTKLCTKNNQKECSFSIFVISVVFSPVRQMVSNWRDYLKDIQGILTVMSIILRRVIVSQRILRQLNSFIL